MNHPVHLFQNPHAAPAVAPSDMATPKRSPAEMIVELLTLESCQPSIDADGDIRFTYKELHYLVLLSRTDPEFVRLVLPNFHAVRADNERPIAYAAANAANSTCKAAKVYVERDRAHAAIECFLSMPEHIVPVLLRCAGALEHAARSYAIALSMQGRG